MPETAEALQGLDIYPGFQRAVRLLDALDTLLDQDDRYAYSELRDQVVEMLQENEKLLPQ